MTTPCFLLELTDRKKRYLRRYVTGKDVRCPEGDGFYHGAMTHVDTITVPLGPDGYERADSDEWDQSDPRWPQQCACGYAFTEDDTWQVFTERLWRRVDTGQEYTLGFRGEDVAPPGAMWDAHWYWQKGPDGRSLCVRLPNGYDWLIDSRASNCTMPDDNEHRCWVRHGEPPNIHVDKQGLTCAAGAGSIGAGNYHGFLHNGCLTS